MSGAPITITLYQNGVHLTYAAPDFITSPALEAEMRRSLDAGEDRQTLASRLLFERGLSRLVRFAIDDFQVEDRRDEAYPGSSAPMPI